MNEHSRCSESSDSLNGIKRTHAGHCKRLLYPWFIQFDNSQFNTEFAQGTFQNDDINILILSMIAIPVSVLFSLSFLELIALSITANLEIIFNIMMILILFKSSTKYQTIVCVYFAMTQSAAVDFKIWTYDDWQSSANNMGYTLVTISDIKSGPIHDAFINFMFDNNNGIQSLGNPPGVSTCLYRSRYQSSEPCEETLYISEQKDCSKNISGFIFSDFIFINQHDTYYLCPYNKTQTIDEALQNLGRDSRVDEDEMAVYFKGSIPTPCGPNIWCYETSISPQTGPSTSNTVTITSTNSDTNETQHVIQTQIIDNDCYYPSISVSFEDIDFSSPATEFFDVFDNNGSLITRCHGTGDYGCDKWMDCVIDQSLGIMKIGQGDSYIITTTGSDQLNTLC